MQLLAPSPSGSNPASPVPLRAAQPAWLSGFSFFYPVFMVYICILKVYDFMRFLYPYRMKYDTKYDTVPSKKYDTKFQA